MHVQSCCFANQAFFFFAVLVAVAVVVAKAPYCRRCAFMILPLRLAWQQQHRN